MATWNKARASAINELSLKVLVARREPTTRLVEFLIMTPRPNLCFLWSLVASQFTLKTSWRFLPLNTDYVRARKSVEVGVDLH